MVAQGGKHRNFIFIFAGERVSRERERESGREREHALQKLHKSFLGAICSRYAAATVVAARGCCEKRFSQRQHPVGKCTRS